MESKMKLTYYPNTCGLLSSLKKGMSRQNELECSLGNAYSFPDDKKAKALVYQCIAYMHLTGKQPRYFIDLLKDFLGWGLEFGLLLDFAIYKEEDDRDWVELLCQAVENKSQHISAILTKMEKLRVPKIPLAYSPLKFPLDESFVQLAKDSCYVDEKYEMALPKEPLKDQPSDHRMTLHRLYYGYAYSEILKDMISDAGPYVFDTFDQYMPQMDEKKFVQFFEGGMVKKCLIEKALKNVRRFLGE